MRNFTFKGLLLTAVFMLLGCLSIQAADDDLITRQITIKLDKAGTLPDRIGSSKKYKITNLKIVGEINGTDWEMIREMAGRSYSGNSTEGNLSVLDLSEAKIVKGGDSYFSGYYSDDNCYTSNDEIGEYAFKDCSRLTSLTLPAGITTIGRNAFSGCSGLTSLTLPAGITSIGRNAFDGCSGLTSLTLPAGITSIGSYAFYGCSGLTSLTLPDGITSIGDDAFWGCSGLTSLPLPATITSIGNCAFYICSGLTSLTLPDGITSIGYSAFEGCSRLKEVRFCINDNLDTYLTKGHPYIDVDCGVKYYINDKEITSIEIPSNVTTLGQYVFQECREFTSLTLPSSITEIGEGAFEGCSGLTSLTLPASISEIGDFAFSDCSGLTSLTLPASISEIGDFAFSDCSGLTSLNLPDGITSISDYAFSGCSGLTSLNLPASIFEIGDFAFSDCSGLTSLTLPDGITEIGEYAFYQCSGLTSIYVYAEKVPKIYSSTFSECDTKKCTVYVPMGNHDDYRLSDFGYFENIVEFDPTGIDKTTTSTDVEEVSRYSVNGQRLVGPTKGLNIVKYSDGSVKKVAVE